MYTVQRRFSLAALVTYLIVLYFTLQRNASWVQSTNWRYLNVLKRLVLICILTVNCPFYATLETNYYLYILIIIPIIFNDTALPSNDVTWRYHNLVVS